MDPPTAIARIPISENETLRRKQKVFLMLSCLIECLFYSDYFQMYVLINIISIFYYQYWHLVLFIFPVTAFIVYADDLAILYKIIMPINTAGYN